MRRLIFWIILIVVLVHFLPALLLGLSQGIADAARETRGQIAAATSGWISDQLGRISPTRSPSGQSGSPGSVPDPACPAQQQLDNMTRAADLVALEALLRARATTVTSGDSGIEYGGFVLESGGRVFDPGAARGERGYIMPRHKYCELANQSPAQVQIHGSLVINAPEYCSRGNILSRFLESQGWHGPASRYDLRVAWRVGVSVVASYHTHPVRTYGINLEGENFSRADIRSAVEREIPEYIITPSCRVKVFMPRPGMSMPLSTNDPCYVRPVTHPNPAAASFRRLLQAADCA